MMFRKSPYHVGGGGYSGLGSRRFTFKKAVKEVMRDRQMNHLQVWMENNFRRMVREELERVLHPLHLCLGRSQPSIPIEPPPQPRFQLRFINSLPCTIFTGSRIETKDGSSIAIELIDTNTNSRVTTGPFSSSRVEIVALDGDFTEENWDSEKFRRSILRPRDGRRPLITGDLVVMLNEGVGILNGEVVFTDNSSWTRSRKFRIGAKISQRGGSSVSQIKEGRSEAFVCKDHRGESYKKHDPPFPDDEVWRLEKIAKDGVLYKRLARNGIRTVKDFLRAYTRNPNWLRNVLGDAAGFPNRTWDVIIGHALRCVLDKREFYIYHGLKHGASLLLNSVYEVMKISFDDRVSQNVDQLNFNQKVVLEELKCEAYSNINSFIQVDERAFAEAPPHLPCPQDLGFNLANSGLHQIDFQDQPGNLIDFDYMAQTEQLMSFDQSSAPMFQLNSQWYRFLSSALRNSFRAREPTSVSLTFPGEDPSDESQGQIILMDRLDSGEITNPHIFSADWSPGSTSWAQQAYDTLHVPGLGRPQVVGVIPGDINLQIAIGSPRARWCKIRAALKFQQVLRYTAARNRGHICI